MEMGLSVVPRLFVIGTKPLAGCGKHSAREIALTDEALTLERLSQLRHRVFDNAFLIPLRRSQISEFDQLGDHRARCNATPEGCDSTYA